MALKPGTRYPAQSVIEAGYPYGRARNVSAPGSGDGFPFEQDYVNDHLGFLQALLLRAGITPSESPDTALVSQYLEAVLSVGQSVAGAAALASTEVENLVAGATNHFYDVCYGRGAGLSGFGHGIFLAVGMSGIDARRYALSQDGKSWTATSTASNRYLGCAHGGPGAIGSRLFLLVGTDAVGRCKIWSAPDNFAIGLVLTECTPSPQPQAWSNHAVWNGTVWVVVGKYNASNNAQFLVSDALTSWDVPAAANSYVGEFKRALALASGRVVAVGTLGVIQTLDDDGTTVAEVFNDSAHGTLNAIIQTGDALLVGSSTGTILRSVDDGDTFEPVVSPFLAAPDASFTTGAVETFAELGGAVVAIVKAAGIEKRMGVLSYDRGATWTKAFRIEGAPDRYVHRAAASDGTRVVFAGGDALLATSAFCSASQRIPV